VVSAAERRDGREGGLSPFFFFRLGSVVNLSIHSFILSFFLLSVGTKGNGWELCHLTGSPEGGGALDSVIL